MTTLVIYQCDLCKRQYDNSQSATNCESQGAFEPRSFVPGLILNLPVFKDHLVYIIKPPYQKKRSPHFGAGRLMFWPQDKRYRDDTLWNLRNLNSQYGFESPDSLMELAAYIKATYHTMPLFYNRITNKLQIIEP